MPTLFLGSQSFLWVIGLFFSTVVQHIYSMTHVRNSLEAVSGTLDSWLVTYISSFADCTSFVVGKNASADGSTFVTIQQDTRSYDPRLSVVPAADHEPGSMRPCPDMPQYQRW